MAVPYQTLARFKSRKRDEVHFVRKDLKTGDLSCSCWVWARKGRCKHTDYVKAYPFIHLSRIPTYQESVHMVWGRDPEAKERWVRAHLKEIVI